ncbi:MAG: flagellar basal body P-ring formation chaperone FlgA [Chitinispirillaceae bacterium]
MSDVNGKIFWIAARTLLFSSIFIAVAVNATSAQEVTLDFKNSVMVSDTMIKTGDLAAVRCEDPELAARVENTSAGESAPPGYSRYVNTDDLVLYRLEPAFENVEFTAGGHKRINVKSDYIERTVDDFRQQITAYVAENLGWEDGEWKLSINNPQSSWKSFRGTARTQLKGMDNPFVKGNFNLLLIVRQGASTNRIPVSCHMQVEASVLVATRQIRRGEELDTASCMLQTMDITHFAHGPLREVPRSGQSEVTRTISQGSIIHERLLRTVPVVARGDQVKILFSGNRIRVSVLGRARESGGRGERVWVENLQTGKLIRAEVTKKGVVSVYREGDNT